MQQVSCPSCGAPVQFRSAASVMAVCDFCKATLVKDADAVRNIGKMSEVLEDYSPIQINTSGVIDGQGFMVVGRVQLRYEAGFWNEWYVLDDAGVPAWLSDASGQLTFTREVAGDAIGRVALPRFETLAPGTPLDMGQAKDGSRALFIASDIRTAQCTGGQGELPFTVGRGYVARVADFRRGPEFLTLDYSDAEAPSTGSSPFWGEVGRGATSEVVPPRMPPPQPSPGGGGSQSAEGGGSQAPTLYRGRSVTLAELKAQLLRDPDTIKDEAGRFKGKISNLECPSCGASIAFSPGATTHLLCPACHAQVDVTGPVAEVIAAAQRVDAVKTSLPLGVKATIAATSYTVIGLMRRMEIGEDAGEWTEYLLYAPRKDFIWLVETDEGWERSEVLNAWPYWPSGDRAILDGQPYAKLYDYQAVVRYAAGAFNWRVQIGDTNEITEFQQGNVKLAAEADHAELTWSRSTPVSGRDLAMWFGAGIAAPAVAKAGTGAATAAPGSYRRAARWLVFLLIAINIIPVLASPGRALLISIIAALGVWLPALLLDSIAGKADR